MVSGRIEKVREKEREKEREREADRDRPSETETETDKNKDARQEETRWPHAWKISIILTRFPLLAETVFLLFFHYFCVFVYVKMS